MVEFYSSSNPGPLGKPSAQKISSVEECRNWDPTVPTSGNPWHIYNPEKENTAVNNSITNSITNSVLNSTTPTNNNINNITVNKVVIQNQVNV